MDFLEDIYVNYSRYYSKSIHAYYKYFAWAPKSIFIESTHSAIYDELRKVHTSAFWKAKLINITKLIKEITLDEIRRH